VKMSSRTLPSTRIKAHSHEGQEGVITETTAQVLSACRAGRGMMRPSVNHVGVTPFHPSPRPSPARGEGD
jgi:hypothetical protein